MQFNTSRGDDSLRISLVPDAPDGGPAASAAPRPFARRRRDRHGRGLRGPLLPQDLPGARTRAEKFEDLVVDSAERLRELWPAALGNVGWLVEEIPGDLESLVASGESAPLGKYTREMPAAAGQPEQLAVIAIYRHPVEALCDTPGQVRELIHEVMIEQVAGLLNIDPDTVDPLFRRYRGH